jgi:hypothetical protein
VSSPRPGRRVAAAASRPVDGGVVVASVLAVLAAVLVLVAGSAEVPADEASRADGVLVDQALDGCVRFRPPPGTRTVVSTGAAPIGDLGSDGTLTYGGPGDPASAEQPDVARGEQVEVDATGNDPESLAIEATGALAAGLFAFQADTTRDGTAAVTECSSPRTSWWFTGAGATLDHTSELVLTNLDPGPAVVDVRVLGLDGEVETLGTRGITVPPGGRTTLGLTDIAPQGEELAVHVLASRGRVVAGLSDTFAAEAGGGPGAEWVPAQQLASRRVRLAALPRRADSHTLVVANPGEREALVEVEVSGGSGAFAPTDNAQVRVPPGSVAAVDLADSVGREASALTLRSPVPVTATVRSVAGGDSTYAPAVRVLTGPAAAPVPKGLEATVQLTAGAQPATARVTAYRKDGSQLGTTAVDIEPSATGTYTVPGTADYLVVAPQEGQVHGAVSYAGEAGLSQAPLRPLTVRVDRPVVHPVAR